MTVVLVEGNELIKWVFANNIGVEYEKQSALVVASNDTLSELDGTSCAKGLILERNCDLQTIL